MLRGYWVDWPVPIPFYGELGSLNPAVVTGGAAHERAMGVGTLVANSVLKRAGQMCTKRGVVLVSESTGGDGVVLAMALTISSHPLAELVNDTVRDQFIAGSRTLASLPGVVVRAGHLSSNGLAHEPVHSRLLEAPAPNFVDGAPLTEIFGPISLVLRYGSIDEVGRLLHSLQPALIGGIHAALHDDADARQLVREMTPGSGRLVWNGPTTGLAVGWATHHGGGYPASTSAHSSVGPTAIRRWLRPVSFRGVPDKFLPEDLRAHSTNALMCRVDGALRNV